MASKLPIKNNEHFVNLADNLTSPQLPETGYYQYHDARSQPWYSSLFAVPIFAQALAAGLFNYDSRVISLVEVKPQTDGSLMWSDVSSFKTNPQRHWSYTFHLFGVRDYENEAIVYNPIYVFSKLYKGHSMYLDPEIHALPDSERKPFLKRVTTGSQKRSVPSAPLTVILPEKAFQPSALKEAKSKLTKSRTDIKSDSKLADELAHALQLIATLTARVEDLEAKMNQEPPGDWSSPLSATPDLESEPERGLNQGLLTDDVQEKLPSQRRRRKKIRANDPNDPRLPMPFPPGHHPNYNPVYYSKQQPPQPKKKDLQRPPSSGRRDPPSMTNMNREKPKFQKPIPKPNPQQYLNPKYSEVSKREQIEFFKKKIKHFNDELSKLRVNPQSLPLEQQSDLLLKRKKIQRGRLRAYKSLECLGVNQFSHNNRVRKHQDLLDRRRGYIPPSQSNQDIPPFTVNNPYYSTAFANGPPFSGYSNVVYAPPNGVVPSGYNMPTGIVPYTAFNALPTDQRRNYVKDIRNAPKNNSNRPYSRQTQSNLSDTASNFAL